MPAAILNLPDNRLYLPEVTLLAVSSVAIGPTIAALRTCLERVRFGAVLFLTDKEQPDQCDPEIEWRSIPRIESKHAFSAFMLRDLHSHIKTSHMLCVQWDGYILDASAWSSEFLNYDYVGAPWPHFDDAMSVGNGGFSLRSTRLMAICAQFRDITGESEDVVICRNWRSRLESEFAMRFAPKAVARRFSFERFPRHGGEFGFHGVFNMVDIIGAQRMTQVMKSLEIGVMADNEHSEVLRWALRRGRLGLAWSVARRMWRRRI